MNVQWSLTRQLMALQIIIVMIVVGIEAMVSFYRGASGLLGLVTLTEVALTLGIGGSLLIADRVYRQTLGLEPAVIARQYQHHQAMLGAVQEGLVITDQAGNLVLANDEARRLLDLPPDGEGTPVSKLLAGTDLAELFTEQDEPLRDQMRVAAGRVLLVSRGPAEVHGDPVGMVLTLRDRTELQAVMRERDRVCALADALQAYVHEHKNQMHTLVGLVELGHHDEVIQRGTECLLLAQLLEKVGDPELAALLWAKTREAAKRCLELRLGPDSAVTPAHVPVEEARTVVGNLVDNALDAAPTHGGWAEVTLRSDDRRLCVIVRDNGPGLPAPLEELCKPGFSTKTTETPGGRGLGLALVHAIVDGMGGTMSADNDGAHDGGAVFHVHLPLATTPPTPQSR
jgi:two-component system, CitB family, sensor kinase